MSHVMEDVQPEQPYGNGANQAASTSFSTVNGYAQLVVIQLWKFLRRVFHLRGVVIKPDLALFSVRHIKRTMKR